MSNRPSAASAAGHGRSPKDRPTSPPCRILIACSSVDGHTRTVGGRIADTLADLGNTSKVKDIEYLDEQDLATANAIVLGASIRYGRYRPALYDFIRRHRMQLDSVPSAFFSVNLVARTPPKDSPERSPYTNPFLTRSGWQPALMAVFAGKLDYQRYRWFDRHMIRLIMSLTGGPTHLDTCMEFTDWMAVRGFATRIHSHLGDGPEPPPPDLPKR